MDNRIHKIKKKLDDVFENLEKTDEKVSDSLFGDIKANVLGYADAPSQNYNGHDHLLTAFPISIPMQGYIEWRRECLRALQNTRRVIIEQLKLVQDGPICKLNRLHLLDRVYHGAYDDINKAYSHYAVIDNDKKQRENKNQTK